MKKIILLLGFFITLISPIYLIISFYNFLPGAPRAFPVDDFIGTEKHGSSETSWGPGHAWYFSIIGSILIFLLAIIYYRVSKKELNIEKKRKIDQDYNFGRVKEISQERKYTKKDFDYNN